MRAALRERPQQRRRRRVVQEEAAVRKECERAAEVRGSEQPLWPSALGVAPAVALGVALGRAPRLGLGR